MSVVNLIQVKLEQFTTETTGIIASVVYQLFDATISQFRWVVDVDLEQAGTNPNANPQETLKAVPIEDPSRAVFNASIGTQVVLNRRPKDMKYLVTGLATYAPGTLSVTLVTLSGCADGVVTVEDSVTFGSVIRLLTYDELGHAAINGGFVYGQLPYGQNGKFTLAGNLLELIPA